MQNPFTPAIVERIETCARDGVHAHGRGLVIVFELSPGHIDVAYMPRVEVPELFAEHLQEDTAFAQWLESYDTETHYVLMSVVQSSKGGAEAEPYLCLYNGPVSVQAA